MYTRTLIVGGTFNDEGGRASMATIDFKQLNDICEKEDIKFFL